ncbi:MAG TPA: hypothetical protein VIG84_07860 [Brevundimonas sp.]
MGFLFNSADGARQFDSESWPCIGHVSRVVVPSSALVPGPEFPFWTSRCIDITINGSAPMIAVRVPTTLHPTGLYPFKIGGLFSTRRNGNSWTFRVYVFSTNGDWSFVYYVIDRMPRANHAMGLTFWDPFTQVVFSSEAPYAHIVAGQTAGRKYAVVGFVWSEMSEDLGDDFNNPTVRYSVTGNGYYELAGQIYDGVREIDGGVISGTAGPNYSARDVGVRQPALIIDVTDIEAADADDYSLNTIDWPNASEETNEPNLTLSSVSRSMSGINRDISLSVTAGLSGNLSAASLVLVSTARGVVGTWTGSGAQSVTVSPGETLSFQAAGSTASGRREGVWSIQINNASDADALVDTLALSLIVDADNNYNLPDPKPDPIVWPDLFLNTNGAAGFTQDVVRRIVGVNQPITLRIAVGARSGAIDVASLGVGVSSISASGPWRVVERLNALTDTYIDVTVQPGDWISLNAAGETLSGRKDYLFGVFIDNLSDGAAQLGAFSASLTVDADNNHNVHDYIPDPVNWSDASSSTNDAGGAVLTNYQTISGISDPITLRFVVGYSGNLSSGSFRVFSATRNAFLGALPLGFGQLDVTVNPGEQINLYCDAGTVSGRRSGTWSVEVRNQFAGGGVIDTVTLSATVDADNNYNVPDPYIDPGAIALYSNNASSSSGDVSASFGGGYATGINQAVTLTAIVSPVYRGGAVPSYFVVYVGSGSAGWDIGQTHDQSFSFEVQPGQYVGASASLSMFPGSGDAWAYWHVDLYNSTTGEYLSGFDGGLTTTR